MLLILGFLLDKKVGVNQPKRIENAKILIANTPMDTDKIKVLHLRSHHICPRCNSEEIAIETEHF